MTDDSVYDPEVLALAADRLGLSDQFLIHAITPQNMGVLPSADGEAVSSGDCGDTIELYLKVTDDRIVDARFMTDGCANTVACGSALTSLIKGRAVAEAAGVDPEAIEAELGGLPEDHHHCAVLAREALSGALQDYFSKRQQPWKKLYNR